ncbi:hypothetical protein IIJ84_004886 [Salmonella enterica subsp. enterica serovar Oranienburg]|nr:hypothetical protein [Salmonella enterica subsp. enterica serovar Oranienburg]ECA1475434.1 hypothetical protein [Salmonella enterica subsp. enterica serovar Oranienburg]ECA9001360.1 hypothetical protein [Salmonella enterica subsp. enterica serovar Oranienburg]ECA9348105.1 hypothetical protein [Salmonella enterica subsp. enterica serovar Oranienburg]ECD3081777.1 hypothetical protein [Salmonella enterica subsp. enterica serovar Oranienburg]
MKIALFPGANLAHFAGHERAARLRHCFWIIQTGSKKLRRNGPAFVHIKFFAGIGGSFFKESSQ